MNEWALALWAMTASRHQWPRPPEKQPAAIVRQVQPPAPAQLSEAPREELRRALDRLAPRLTGRLVYDPKLRMYVPELKPEQQPCEKEK